MQGYIAKDAETLEGEYGHVLQATGKVLQISGLGATGSVIGLGEAMEEALEELAVETFDYERKKSAAILYSLQPQHELFGRAYA